MTASIAGPDWDLTPYFSALGADDYQVFRDDLLSDLDGLQRRVADLPAVADSVSGWAEFLSDLEAVMARYRHLSSFLGCWTAADATDALGQREEAALAKIGAAVEQVEVRVAAAFKGAEDDAFEALLATPSLEAVRYALTRMRQAAAYTMAAPLESLSADLAVDGLGAWGRLYDRISGNLKVSLEVPGEPAREEPASMVRSLLEDPEPRVRDAAFAGSAAAWRSVAEPVAACLNAIAGTRLTLYEKRGVSHFLDPALFDAGIRRETLDAMWRAVRSRQHIARRFLRHKAGLLGKRRLGFQDRMAPLPRDDAARIPWDEAKAQVTTAFAASYPALREFAEHAFGNRWVDYQPRAGKRPGGFCSSSSVLGQSRIFMTYHGAAGDVQTLAHELGHAFHSWLMRDMRHWQRRYPMTLAETASTFAEKLVTDAALEVPGLSSRDRAAMLDQRLQDAEAFLLDIPMRFDFEHELYTRRASGELTVSDLQEMMLSAQRSNFGDALDEDQLDPWFWASKLHFYITGISFYNFPYTFGYLFSMGLFARAKEEGRGFLPRYEALLRETGSAPAETVAWDALGVDLEDEGFWHSSIDMVEGDLDDLLAMTELVDDTTLG
jgi:oligoendopeptidase F